MKNAEIKAAGLTPAEVDRLRELEALESAYRATYRERKELEVKKHIAQHGYGPGSVVRLHDGRIILIKQLADFGPGGSGRRHIEDGRQLKKAGGWSNRNIWTAAPAEVLALDVEDFDPTPYINKPS